MTRSPTSIAEPSRRTLFGLAAGAAIAPVLPAAAAAAAVPDKRNILEAVAYARVLRPFCPSSLEVFGFVPGMTLQESPDGKAFTDVPGDRVSQRYVRVEYRGRPISPSNRWSLDAGPNRQSLGEL